jgi:hypothetical protein
VAIEFLRAFWLVSPHLGLRELSRWINCGVRLAQADVELAADFYRPGTDLLLRLPPPVRSRLLEVADTASYIHRGELLRAGFRAALTIAAGTTDFKLGARILDVAIRIGQRSFGFNCDYLQHVAEIIPHYSETNPTQRVLFLQTLELTERFPVKLAVEFLRAAAPFIVNARSEGPDLGTTLLCERLVRQTGRLIDADDTGALKFFLAGAELLRLKDATLVDKWAAVCDRLISGEGRAFGSFVLRAVEPTRMLVALALARGAQASALAATALDCALAVSERSAAAAINCYATAPTLLSRISPGAYKDWVAHGLASFSDSNRLAAYFAAESRASQQALDQNADALRLEEVAPVLKNYVRMLAGRELPLVSQPLKYDALEPDDGQSIALPPAISDLATTRQRFSLYKALAAQRAGQIEFGSCATGTEDLQTLGAALLKRFPRFSPVALNGDTDWRTLIALFPQSTLARRIFTILENARIEYRLRRSYRGLGRDLALARSQRQRQRPPDQYIMKYEPLLEVLFAEALGAGARNVMDNSDQELAAHPGWLAKVREVLAAHIYIDRSSVADSIRACWALYEHLNPEAPQNSAPWEDPRARRAHKEERQSPPERQHLGPRAAGEKTAAGNDDERATGQPAFTLAERPETDGLHIPSASVGAPASLDDVMDARAFFYDEWDSYIGDYRPRWCRVIEYDWQSGDMIFVKRTRAAYRGVLSQIRSQFQLLRPAGLKRTRAQPDGDDLDLEALMDHIVDRRARRPVSERIYTARQHLERDVAVCFLLDMSGSTSDRISSSKRVLDVEKEALLLMSEALEAVGDAYAIYGFSSSGRSRVSFFLFKGFAEPYGTQVERRIGGAASLANTRLGAAIRHATWRLNQQPASTRLLIILSDARPSDVEYNSPGYARGDTRVALKEARASGVVPFCITFNRGGHLAEIEEMFEGTGYAVIDNVLSLPERLPGIYRRLTS